MSAPALRAAAPARRATAARAAGTRLRVLAPLPRTPSRLPVVLACAGLMLATLLTVLVLNIQLSRGSYAAHDLAAQRTRLAEQEQALREELAADSAPGALADRARALGMVPGGEPGFVRLSDGTVSGDPQPAQAPTPPAPAPEASGAAAEDSSPTTPPSAKASSTASPRASSTASPSTSRTAPAPEPTG